ncbi:MBL fold metallo-hydrolase [Nocardia sp. NPDC059091]|uniref:MBL fold metallo-hydrolase n=1 Tax=unclassified Nocardia TaxID=2637762 RepID=UPI0036B7D10B
MTETQSVPDHTQAAGSTAFIGFALDQVTHLYSRGHGAGGEAEIIEAAPRTYYLRPGIVNVGLFETDEGLLMVDTGLPGDGPALLRAVRSISDKPLHTVVYTHGHVDHAFGLWAFLEAGETPRIIAHENLIGHFERYMKTPGLNTIINNQLAGGTEGKAWPAAPADFVWPTETFRDTLELTIGGERFEVRHGKGETDDCAWVWAPERRVIAAGDLVTGYLPNAGNPRKVQRYAEEWAEAAETMVALGPEVVLPGHGVLVRGADAIRDELSTMAAYLRHIVDHTLAGLNAGVLHDEIVRTLRIPEELAAHPRLPAIYDRPEFICRNVIRRYSGWWDGYLADLLPAPRRDQAAQYAELAGGADALVIRARELAVSDIRLACHLAETAFLAAPGDAVVRQCYVEIFSRRGEIEPALMAKAIFGEAFRRSQEAEGDRGDTH